MQVTELAPGLWRWTAPHPAWRPSMGGPGGWEEEVGCIYLEAPSDSGFGIVLIDPLAPPAGSPDATRFWAALDRDVARCGGALAVLVTNAFHSRSTAEVYRRYSGSAGVHVHVPDLSPRKLFDLATDRLQEGPVLPGVVAIPIEGLEPSETALWLSESRSLVFADALIGTGSGEVRLARPAQAAEGAAAEPGFERALRTSVERLLRFDAERLLPSHGEPVLSDGRAALARALVAPRG